VTSCTSVPHGTERTASKRAAVVTVADLHAFDDIIDARSPVEYGEDRVPGAVNLPVLEDEERARVGTIYAQESPFKAKKAGAALVSRNLARHLDSYFADKPRDYRPLVYCWRGGSRSGAMTQVLRAVGWNAAQLEGGYKAYRRTVVTDLLALPARLRFIVVCGRTGVGKTVFLRAVNKAGAQVLDLEDLAAHMGSVLGAYPDRPQPSQKLFESLIWHVLRHLDPEAPVFVESESKKIGNLHTPEALLACMRASECMRLDGDMDVRIALLKEAYAHLLDDPDALGRQLDCLTALQGREKVQRWQGMAVDGRWDELIAELLVDHYDPAYRRSLARNYAASAGSPDFRLSSAEPQQILGLARQVIDYFDGKWSSAPSTVALDGPHAPARFR
jgi:tRNA 2-selenouridine synthase